VVCLVGCKLPEGCRVPPQHLASIPLSTTRSSLRGGGGVTSNEYLPLAAVKVEYFVSVDITLSYTKPSYEGSSGFETGE
jgi:hypothetical protein